MPGQPRTATAALRRKSRVTAAATRDIPAPQLATKARVTRIFPGIGSIATPLYPPAAGPLSVAFEIRFVSTVIPGGATSVSTNTQNQRFGSGPGAHVRK